MVLVNPLSKIGAAEWKTLWKKHAAEDDSQPEIDFASQTVVAIFYGPAKGSVSLKMLAILDAPHLAGLIVPYELELAENEVPRSGRLLQTGGAKLLGQASSGTPQRHAFLSVRHFRAGGNLVNSGARWISSCTGMAKFANRRSAKRNLRAPYR